jgi:hypothetical protein
MANVDSSTCYYNVRGRPSALDAGSLTAVYYGLLASAMQRLRRAPILARRLQREHVAGNGLAETFPAAPHWLYAGTCRVASRNPLSSAYELR